MKCPTCAASVPDNSVFCPQCGARLGHASDDAMSAAEPSATAATAASLPAGSSPAARAMAGAASGLRGSARAVPEEELWTGGYSPKAMYGPWLGAAIVTIAGLIAVPMLRPDTLGWSIFGVGAIVLWGGLFLLLAYRRLSVKYRLTSQRLFHEQGVLRRVTDRIEVIDIDDVTFEQGIIERMLDVGTIRITSSDRSSPELSMPGIDNVKEVADTIDHARRTERQRRGLFIESV